MKQDSKGVVDVLKHARLVTEQQLQRAYRTQEKTGDSLKDILFRELSWDTVKEFLNYEIPTPFSGEKRALGAALKEAGWLSQEQLDEAEQEAQRTGRELGRKLVEDGLLTPEQLEHAHAYRQETSLPLWRTVINLGYLNPRQLSEALGIGSGGETATATAPAPEAEAPPATPAGPQETAWLQGGSQSEALQAGLGRPEAIRGMSAVEVVEAIIDSAVSARATDIHLDPQEGHMRVRFRIDGMLYDVMGLPHELVPEVISRLKVIAGMDITQHRHAQEGHFVHRMNEVEIDLRLATAPTVLGEKFAIRLLSEKNVLKGVAQLGMEPHHIELVELLMARPYGMVLATGPVGAGKTTTLYAPLNEVNILSKNVMTIEDPVEYQLRGVNQMQVNSSAGFSFVAGLRAILRQDPNIIMVGEIRDEETAMTAVKAAMTGVLVLSTLHANNAPGAIGSLVGLNVPRFLVSNALIGVLAQRLVRKICPHCKEGYQPSKDVLEQLRVPEPLREKAFYRGRGCDRCFHTGYFGRTGVFEVLAMNDELREAIFRGESHNELRRLALKGGMQTLSISALNKVLDGTTSAEEFLRVIFT
jgi:type IV pilus assembly protein PilB